MRALFIVMPILFFALTNLYSQNNFISGKIYDEFDEPITEASVYIEGTNIGDASDSTGSFIIKNLKEQKIFFNRFCYRI